MLSVFSVDEDSFLYCEVFVNGMLPGGGAMKLTLPDVLKLFSLFISGCVYLDVNGAYSVTATGGTETCLLDKHSVFNPSRYVTTAAVGSTPSGTVFFKPSGRSAGDADLDAAVASGIGVEPFYEYPTQTTAVAAQLQGDGVLATLDSQGVCASGVCQTGSTPSSRTFAAQGALLTYSCLDLEYSLTCGFLSVLYSDVLFAFFARDALEQDLVFNAPNALSDAGGRPTFAINSNGPILKAMMHHMKVEDDMVGFRRPFIPDYGSFWGFPVNHPTDAVGRANKRYDARTLT